MKRNCGQACKTLQKKISRSTAFTQPLVSILFADDRPCTAHSVNNLTNLLRTRLLAPTKRKVWNGIVVLSEDNRYFAYNLYSGTKVFLFPIENIYDIYQLTDGHFIACVRGETLYGTQLYEVDNNGSLLGPIYARGSFELELQNGIIVFLKNGHPILYNRETKQFTKVLETMYWIRQLADRRIVTKSIDDLSQITVRDQSFAVIKRFNAKVNLFKCVECSPGILLCDDFRVTHSLLCKVNLETEESFDLCFNIPCTGVPILRSVAGVTVMIGKNLVMENTAIMHYINAEWHGPTPRCIQTFSPGYFGFAEKGFVCMYDVFTKSTQKYPIGDMEFVSFAYDVM